jgi:hypothetical protein
VVSRVSKGRKQKAAAAEATPAGPSPTVKAKADRSRKALPPSP